MKTRINKNIVLKVFFISFIRFSFLAIMILGVSFASTRTNRQDAMPESGESNGLSVIGLQSFNKNITLKKPEKNTKADCGRAVECVIHPIILKAALRHQVDPALIKAIIMAESGYKIRAISKSGAKGLMQLMPGTAEALGVTDVFNPKENISGGVRYFKQLVNQFDGNIKLALAAYNAGSKKVLYYNGIPPYKATQYYIKKVFKYYDLYKNQMTEEVDKA